MAQSASDCNLTLRPDDRTGVTVTLIDQGRLNGDQCCVIPLGPVRMAAGMACASLCHSSSEEGDKGDWRCEENERMRLHGVRHQGSSHV